MVHRSIVFAVPAAVVASVLAVTPACKSDNNSNPPAPVVFGTTGVVAGADNGHCAGKTVTVDPAQCTNPKPADSEPASDAGGDAGGDDTDGGADNGGSDFGATNDGFEADDDDCKYHMKWAMNTNAENADVTFTVVLTVKVDGSAEKGAPISAEVFLSDTHPAPNSGQKSSETSTPGTYNVGPVRFDAPGKWTVRFHVNETCADSEESPHGHAAFFVQVQ